MGTKVKTDIYRIAQNRQAERMQRLREFQAKQEMVKRAARKATKPEETKVRTLCGTTLED